MYYFDNAATTKVSKNVLEKMLPFLRGSYGNPSSIYKLGRESKKAIEKAREQVATNLNCKTKEIYFTNSGTESDNWALKGIALANQKKGKHIITTQIEHHAILHSCEYLEKHGFEVTYLPVQENGILDIKDLKKSIRDDTILISVMFANNEIGTIQPIQEIGQIAKEKNIYFHTDAVQAVGNVKIDLKKLNIDLLTFSGHKIHGPKGTGVLYIKEGTNIHNLLHGGGQEKRRRPSTENVPGIVGLGQAIEDIYENFEKRVEILENLREKTIEELLKIPNTRLNGDRKKRLPGNVNVCFEYIEGESILLHLDKLGISASSGSACTSGSLEPSHVLLAIGLPHEIAHGSLRLTFSEKNTLEEVNHLLQVLPEIVEKLRKISPLYNQTKK